MCGLGVELANIATFTVPNHIQSNSPFFALIMRHFPTLVTPAKQPLALDWKGRRRGRKGGKEGGRYWKAGQLYGLHHSKNRAPLGSYQRW